MKFLKTLLLAHALIIGFANLSAAEDAMRSVPGISYYPAEKPIQDPEKRCVVDLKIPVGQQGFATLVWFHGGGLTGGDRDFPQFDGKGVALVRSKPVEARQYLKGYTPIEGALTSEVPLAAYTM